MTREETIKRLCKLVGTVWNAIDPESNSASDCFCSDARPLPCGYRNEGKAIEFIEEIVGIALDERAAFGPNLEHKDRGLDQ